MHEQYTPKGAMPQATSQLAELLRRLPGFGSRTATMAAIRLSKGENNQPDELASAIRAANGAAGKCQECHGLADQAKCAICRNPSRRAEQICVVQRPEDIETIESVGYYTGRYHVLHGALEPLRGVGPDQLTMSSLLKRAASLDGNPMAEIILATGTTLEGTTTADYIVRSLARQSINVTVTTLRKGIADRATVEFADPATLNHAISNRSDEPREFSDETT